MNSPTFQEAVAMIEALPEEQRWSFMDIVRRRLVEERRNEIPGPYEEAREEHARGEVKRGTVDDLLRELPE